MAFEIGQLRTMMVCLLALPVGTAALVALLGSRWARTVRWLALAATIGCLILASILAIGLVQIQESRADLVAPKASLSTPVPTFEPEIVPGALDDSAKRHQTTWTLLHLGPASAVRFHVGLDGLNVWLVVLTALLLFSSVLISWTSIHERVAEFHAWLLLLATGMFGVFLAFDIILFYVFFELTLVPLFFLIGIWGGPERRHAARKFFIYTLTGSMITLIGLLAVVLVCHQKTGQPMTFSIPELIQIVNHQLAHSQEQVFWRTFQLWIFLALVAGFAIKVPLVPLHTWLPLAHVEAPTAGSVLLAGVLLKIGAYGFLRLCLPLTPDVCLALGVKLIGGLAVIGILYGALCALAQDDIKKMVAYSSVSHLGFCMLGMFALNETGLAGSVLTMINHGLSTGALFLLVGMLYERYHTRKISAYGGMGAKLGLLAFCMVFICLSSIGLPGLNGFVGEALVLFGMFATNRWLAIVASAGIVLGAWYLLSVVMRVFFGSVKEPSHGSHLVPDVNLREGLALAPIMILCVVLGVYPQPVLDTTRRDIRVVTNLLQRRGATTTEQKTASAPRSEGTEGD
jgi:NADH-quinone oxidoreductase subunit M